MDRKRKTKTGYTTYWKCSVRNNNTHCLATVTQRDESFTRGKHPHCHGGAPGRGLKAKITREVKERQRDQIFGKSGKIVGEIFKEVGENPNLPNPSNETKKAQRVKSTM